MLELPLKNMEYMIEHGVYHNSRAGLTQEVMAALNSIEMAADVEHVTDVHQIGECGVIETPALLINGKLRSVGRVPSRNQIWE